MSGPCPLEATDDDMLCDPCREAEKNAKALHDGVYGTGLIYAIRSFRRRGTSMGHCHACDPEYYNKGDGNGNSGGPA